MSISCAKCGGSWTKTTDSRSQADGAIIRRRKECQIDDCQHRFTTWEVNESLYSKLRVIDPKVHNVRKFRDAIATIGSFADVVLTQEPER